MSVGCVRQVNDAVPFDIVGCEKIEEHLKRIVGVLEHAGRDFVGEIKMLEDDGFGGEARAVVEF